MEKFGFLPGKLDFCHNRAALLTAHKSYVLFPKHLRYLERNS